MSVLEPVPRQEDAVREAMSLWEERERWRLESFAYGEDAPARRSQTAVIPITTLAPEPYRIRRDIPAVAELLDQNRLASLSLLREFLKRTLFQWNGHSDAVRMEYGGCM